MGEDKIIKAELKQNKNNDFENGIKLIKTKQKLQEKIYV
jgi:hypothetical protein